MPSILRRDMREVLDSDNGDYICQTPDGNIKTYPEALVVGLCILL